MFLSICDKSTRHIARKTKVIDMDIGIEIPLVRWANDVTGRYRQILTDSEGHILVDKKKGKVLSKIFKGNIKFEFMG